MNAYEIGGGAAWSALGDRTRHSIVAVLADGPRSVGELAADLPVSRPAVSQALKILKDAGLVSEQPVGARRVYRLNPTAVEALRDQLNTFWTRALSSYSESVEHQPAESRRRSARDRNS